MEVLHTQDIPQVLKGQSQDVITLVFANIKNPKESFTYTITYEDLKISMKELIQRLNKEKNCSLKITDLFGFNIKKEETVEYYRNLQPFYIEDLKPKGSNFVEFSILVKTLIGKTIDLVVNSLMTVEDIKDLIHQKEAIPSEQQRIIFSNRVLEDEKYISDAGISEGSVIHLVLRLRGGGATGLSFVDLTEDNKAVVKQWSNSAPRWRTVTAYGLCLEGKCKNCQCQAFGKWVIISKGMGCYDLITDKDSNYCSECYEAVEPEKCAFTNCLYSFVGTKLEPGKPLQKVVSPKEIKVDDHYKLFDPDTCGKVDWISLKIITKDLKFGNMSSVRYLALIKADLSDVCGVCCKKIEGEGQQLDCTHKFHDECYHKLKDLNVKCSICHL